MADIPQFSATADVVNNNESSEILYIGYINATLPETINYINRLLDSGFVSAEYSDPLTSTKDTLSEGRFYWSSKLTRGEILIEILWYDKDVAVKSGDQEYNYSLTIKICNMEISE